MTATATLAQTQVICVSSQLGALMFGTYVRIKYAHFRLGSLSTGASTVTLIRSQITPRSGKFDVLVLFFCAVRIDSGRTGCRSGTNGFHQYNIFKDNQHVMYTDGNGNQCRSIYYALDVSLWSAVMTFAAIICTEIGEKA